MVDKYFGVQSKFRIHPGAFRESILMFISVSSERISEIVDPRQQNWSTAFPLTSLSTSLVKKPRIQLGLTGFRLGRQSILTKVN